jgi:hypothetical protein
MQSIRLLFSTLQSMLLLLISFFLREQVQFILIIPLDVLTLTFFSFLLLQVLFSQLHQLTFSPPLVFISLTFLVLFPLQFWSFQPQLQLLLLFFLIQFLIFLFLFLTLLPIIFVPRLPILVLSFLLLLFT